MTNYGTNAGQNNNRYTSWSNRSKGRHKLVAACRGLESLEGRAMFNGAASFVATDMTTAGNWKGHYGSSGYNVIGDTSQLTASATTITPTGASEWDGPSSNDASALQTANGSGRVLAALYSSSNFSVDLNFTDGQSHRVSTYIQDMYNLGRNERIDVVDAATGQVLDSRTASGFSGGEYLSWDLTGHVQLKVTNLSGPNAVLGGVFVDPSGATVTPTPTPTTPTPTPTTPTPTTPTPTAPTVAPTAPSNLTGSSTSAGKITLNWSSTSSNQSGFNIWRAGSNGAWAVVGTASGTATTYTDTGLAPGSTYSYVVRATNSLGDSPNSNLITASTLGTPASLAGDTSTANQIKLTWTDAATDVTGFNVWRSSNVNGNWSVVGTATTSTYIDRSVAAGTTYSYVVRATTPGGDSANSNLVALTATATTTGSGGGTTIAPVTPVAPVVAPTAPSALTGTATSTSQVNLSWTRTSTNETGFNIWRSTSMGTGWAVVGSAAAGATSFNDTNGITAGTTYYYAVRATNSAGDSVNSNFLTITAPAAAVVTPTAPLSLAGTATSTTQISLTWLRGSSNETRFNIWRSTSMGSGWAVVGTAAAGATSYSDTGLSAGTTYYYAVRAVNAAGESANSNFATVATSGGAVNQSSPPSAPILLGTYAGGPMQVHLMIQDSGDGKAQYYLIQRYGATNLNWTDAGTAVAGTTDFVDTVPVYDAWNYRVIAYNSAGASAPSQVWWGIPGK